MQLNDRKVRTFEQHVFATLLDTLAIDYHVQVPFDDYWLEHYGIKHLIVDFVIYQPQCVIFEIDGPGSNGWRARRDRRMRDEFLSAQGFRVVHITESELRRSSRMVASRVWHYVFGDA